MGKLKTFINLKEKKDYFLQSEHFIIDSKAAFDLWFDGVVGMKKEERTNFIFRGMKEAKHRLYTSGQRIWIENDMVDWSGQNYIGFIDALVESAKQHPLIEKVFDVYNYTIVEREFPILSILQHYGAPTPLMDWTYNINVALFFGTEGLKGGHGTGDIDNYFSIYAINKAHYKHEFLNKNDFDKGGISSINSFEEWSDDDRNPNKNGIFYISDFDNGNAFGAPQYHSIRIRANRPMTSVYNQNIIPQEGLFIFNPFSNKPIDEVFNVKAGIDGSNLILRPFTCVNIKKDLADYVRRRIKQHSNIDHNFIYPHLYDDVKIILNNTLNEFV